MLPYTLNTFSNLKSSKLICRFLCVDIRTLKSCPYFNWYFEEDIPMTRFKELYMCCRIFLIFIFEKCWLLIQFQSRVIRLHLQFSDQFGTKRIIIWLSYLANNFNQANYQRKLLQNNGFLNKKLTYLNKS